MSMPKSILRLVFTLFLSLAAGVVLRAADPAPDSTAPTATTPAPTPVATPTAESTPAADATADLAKQLADVENKLTTALRSYTLLQNENDQLKANAARDQAAVQAAADKAVTEAQGALAKTSIEATAQTSALSDEVRQLRAQASALAVENAQLKTRLAISGPPPGTTLVSPTRPGAAADKLMPEVVTPKPDSAPLPRTHTVAAGDNLAKISKRYYGTTVRWEEILKANGEVIKNENNLAIGTTLKIP